MTALTQHHRDQILDAAILAPSADNRPPWLYEWQKDGQALVFFRHPERTGNATDVNFDLSNLTTATAIESAVLTAETLGFTAECDYFSDLKGHVATLTFSAVPVDGSNPINQRLAEAIPQRRTNRVFPFHGNIDKDQHRFLAAATDSEHCQLHLFTDRQDIKSATEVMKYAEAVRFRHQALHEELFSALVFDDKEPNEGMTLPMLGVSERDTWFFKWVSQWKNMRRFNKFLPGSKIIAKRSVDVPFKKAPAVVLLTSEDVSSQGMIHAGRQMMRFWLAATSLGLSVHPYAAPSVLSLARNTLTSEIQADLAPVSSLLAKVVNENTHPIMFFRVGFSESYSKKSGRPDREALAR